MVRLRPSAARARAAAVPKPRMVTTSTSARLALRSRFRHARPIVSRRLAGTPAGSTVPAIGYVKADVVFSKEPVTINVGIGHLGDLLERWAHIQAGLIPPDDDNAPHVMSAEEADEREADMIADIESAAKTQEVTIRENAAEEAEYHRKRAEMYSEMAIDNPAMSAKAESELEEAELVIREAQIQIENIADDVREERAAIRRQISSEYESQIESQAEYIATLKAGLDNEVRKGLQEHYIQERAETEAIVEWWFK